MWLLAVFLPFSMLIAIRCSLNKQGLQDNLDLLGVLSFETRPRLQAQAL